MREEYLQGDDENFSPAEKEIEKALRPLSFDDFTGQFKIVENIKVFVQATKQREEALDHVLLHGPPGLGKTTLSHIIANELNANIKVTSWSSKKCRYKSYFQRLVYYRGLSF